ncbi:MAG: hypothetical protein H6581_07825 [Bacteroidia bacterium]|nr:hypothetical protein [Bacteroidia bacterium]
MTKPVSRTYLWQAWLSAGFILLGNPLTLKLGIQDEFLREKALPFVVLVNLLLLICFFYLLRKRVSLQVLFQTSPNFNLLFTAFFFLALFAGNRIFTCKFKLIRLILLFSLLVQYTRTFHLWVVKNPLELGKIIRNLATLEYALGVVFLLLEMIFMFQVKSRGAFPDSFSQISWNNRYLGGLNSMGMREREIPPKHPEGKKVLFLLGDSFAYGWGIEKREERTSELLAQSTDYEVYNLGVPGSDIANQWENLEKIGWIPEQMVVFWNPNDIHRQAQDNGLELDFIPSQSYLEDWPHFLTHYSFFLNWLKCEWIHHGEDGEYAGYLNRAFQNRAVFKAHINQDWGPADRFLTGDSLNRPLAVLFPLMGDVKVSQPWLKGMEEWLNFRGWEVLNLAPLLEMEHPKLLTVNAFDQHPSAWVNEFLADTLIKRLKQTPTKVPLD